MSNIKKFILAIFAFFVSLNLCFSQTEYWGGPQMTDTLLCRFSN